MSNLTDKIDTVIDKMENKPGELSPEVAELVDILADASETIAKLKAEKQDKTPINQIFTFPNMKELSDKLDTLLTVVAENNKLSLETVQNITESVQKIKIEMPQVVVPEIKMPTVTVPPIVVPEAKITFPSVMEVKKSEWWGKLFNVKPITDLLLEIKKKISDFAFPTGAEKYISVRLTDGEKFYRARVGSMSLSGGGGGASALPTDPNTNGSWSFTYTGSNLTRIDVTIDGNLYRRTMTYDGSDNLSTMSPWQMNP